MEGNNNPSENNPPVAPVPPAEPAPHPASEPATPAPEPKVKKSISAKLPIIIVVTGVVIAALIVGATLFMSQ